jgi:outer membrane beta-barrel protein
MIRRPMPTPAGAASRTIVAAVSLALGLAPARPSRAAEEPRDETDEKGADKADKADKKDEIPAGGDACIDEEVKADLFAKRKRRDVRERMFQQTNRHELTVSGGYYASDLFDGTYVVGGSYAYHMTEDFAVEASARWTRIVSSAEPELERRFSLLGGKDHGALLFDADLVWDPAHGKLRLGGAILHFDPYIAAGAGVVDSVLSSDIAANVAVGLKFFLGRAISIRIDVRDHVYRQQLLERKAWVNDVSTTIGIGIFLPVRE